jgi:fatty-acyl-CoA synthase
MRNVLREGLANAAVLTRLARQTGFLWTLTQHGAGALLRVFARGSQNPSLIYRVHAANSPNKTALVWRDRATTWRELDERIDQVASGLERRGLGRGKSFVMMVTNRPEAVELAAGATRAGAAAVSISYRSTASELAYFVNHSGAGALFLEEATLGVLEAARAELPEEVLRNVFVIGGTGPGSFESLLVSSS